MLDDLARRTDDQMEAIDVAAEELKEKLVPPPRVEEQGRNWISYESLSSERWWKGNVVSCLAFMVRGTVGFAQSERAH